MRNNTRSICVTSGKGGVGKTTISCNLAFELSQQGRRVLLFDGDMGMANAELLFGVRTNGNISELLSGSKSINDILTPVYKDLYLISGGNAVDQLQNLDAFQRKAIMDAFSDLQVDFDDLIIDTSPGLNDNVLYLNSAADERLVVITREPTSFSDAYGLIKTLNQRFRQQQFTVICNLVDSESEGLRIFKKFAEVVNRFLNVGLDYAGCIVRDRLVAHSVRHQCLIMKQFEESSGARSMRQAFAKYKAYKGLPEAQGGLDFFLNQVMGVA